jgi:hypothetical protein
VLIAAVFLDFWSQKMNEETADSENCYSHHFCKIEETLTKIGPWAILIGKPLFSGIKNFSTNEKVKNAITKFKNENLKNRECLDSVYHC